MSVIRNFDELATTPLRRDALDILEAGYKAVNTEEVIRRKITLENGELCVEDSRFRCLMYERIFVIGVGKCAIESARVLEDILGDAITDGIILDIVGGELRRMSSHIGTHPFPSEQNVSVTKKIVEMLRGVTERDLVITVISGGGSSLLCLPFQTDCETLTDIHRTLMKKGADIHELNTVRKHLSDIQGGQLAQMAYPAQVVSLIFSDVLGNDLSVIASGPTVRDTTTVDDARSIMDKYDVLKVCTLPYCELKETPKEEKYFKNVENILVATNMDALSAMKAVAEKKGYKTHIETDMLSGEAREVGRSWAVNTAWKTPRTCVLAGGETTVTIHGKGKGGRNQEFVLGALSHVGEGGLLLSAGSDGRDNTDAAGAIADGKVLREAQDRGLDPEHFLEENDSFTFFSGVNGQIITGNTGSNVSDLMLLLRE